MKWLNSVVITAMEKHPSGEIIVESGISPSGSYHMGYLREIIICDAVVLELQHRGRQAKHIHFVDDLDGFRKVPANLPADYEKYLGVPLCDIPSPDGSKLSYADYALEDFLGNVKKLGIELEIRRSHEEYRKGFFAESIEQALKNVGRLRKIIENVSGRKLDPQWSPIQVNEGGYLKKRPFLEIDVEKKIIYYLDKDGEKAKTSYTNGEVKLDWRLDWPARWSLLNVAIEPFGRDHATKGGSYDTGKDIIQEIYGGQAPLPIAYEFVNRAGDTKKMSASQGNGIMMNEVTSVLPPEISRYLILKTSPEKTIYFDPVGGVTRLIDDFAELLANKNKEEDAKQLVRLCLGNLRTTTISQVPFSHLAASYQTALRDPKQTLDVIGRTEYKSVVDHEEKTIKQELTFIDNWLDKWAPEEAKFELLEGINSQDFAGNQIEFFAELANQIEKAPSDADGEWFHKTIYSFKETSPLSPKELFTSLYRLLIGKDSGPRAGWFLSMLPREWLVKRLRMKA